MHYVTLDLQGFGAADVASLAMESSSVPRQMVIVEAVVEDFVQSQDLANREGECQLMYAVLASSSGVKIRKLGDVGQAGAGAAGGWCWELVGGRETGRVSKHLILYQWIRSDGETLYAAE